MKTFTYYTIIGRNLDLLRGHVENVKKYAGFDKLSCKKEFNVIIYKNNKIKKEITDSIIQFCKEQNIRPIIYDEKTDDFLENLYACWNLGYESAQEGYVFRGGSDQVFSRDSFISLYKSTKQIKNKKTILQANTIECRSKLKSIGAQSRHFVEDFGDTFSNMNFNSFEKFIDKINCNVKEELLTIDMAIKYWNKPKPLYGKFGKTNRTDGCSWLMTKQDWLDYGPLPIIENGITGDVIIHDIFQENGYENLIVRDCVTYHFVQGESTEIQTKKKKSVLSRGTKKVLKFLKNSSQ
ncbi:MAG: hypothetical protein K5793_07725 [Nitrosarchaeum sp.]|nr:hypothetical protein [Nitrosarchaeum sp.]